MDIQCATKKGLSRWVIWCGWSSIYIYIHPRGAYGPINNLLEVKDVSKNHLLEGAGT